MTVILHIVLFHYVIGVFIASFGAVFGHRHGNRGIIGAIHTPDDLKELRKDFRGGIVLICAQSV